MRRNVASLPIRCGRRISAYNFGHPELTTEFQFSAPKSTAAVDAGVRLTKLANGARIITHDRQGPQASVGVYVQAGPKYDPLTAPGLSYVLRWALPTSNFENSLFQIDKTARAKGVSSEHVEVRKSLVGWKVEGRVDAWQKPFENLLTCVAAPRFPAYDVDRFRDTMDNILDEQRWQRPRDYVVDKLETVAFFKEPLGNPRLVPQSSNDDCSPAALTAHWSKFFVPSNVIVAGINVNHTELCAAYENAPFPHSATAPHHSRAGGPVFNQKPEELQYTGGELHEPEHRAKAMGTSPDMRGEVAGALGYLTVGRADVNTFALGLVLQQLLDVTLESAIEAERVQTLDGLRTFYRPFDTAGLLGISFFGEPADATKLTIAGAQAIKNIKIDSDTVALAVRRAAVAFYHTEIEYQRDYLDFLAGSVKGESNIAAAAVLTAIQSVTAEQLTKAHKAVLASKPSLFATGETLLLPSLRQLGF